MLTPLRSVDKFANVGSARTRPGKKSKNAAKTAILVIFHLFRAQFQTACGIEEMEEAASADLPAEQQPPSLFPHRSRR
jgi:hypothetical protein